MSQPLDEKALEEAIMKIWESGEEPSPEFLHVNPTAYAAIEYMKTWYIDLFSPKGLGLLFPNLKGFK